MAKKICIIAAKDFLAAALGMFHTSLKVCYSADETKKLFEESSSRLTGGEPYPAKYLFGRQQASGKSRGLIELYLDYGYDVEIRSATDASEILGDGSRDSVAFDLLFSSASVESVISALNRGSNILGWTPPEFASKSFQMLALASSAGGAVYLPRSLIIPSGVRPGAAGFESLRGFFDSEYIIIKSAYGAAGRLTSNLEYAVVPTRLFGSWILKLAAAVESEFKQDVIISELIVTDDTYASRAENVVHKINCCGLFNTGGKSVFSPLNGCCKKIACRMDFGRLSAHRPTRFGELVTDCFWLDANIANVPGIKDIFKCFDGFAACGCACTLDFMIPRDGKPRFLELNKLSATLSDTSPITEDSAINIYARTASRDDSAAKKSGRVEEYAKVIKKIKDRFYSKTVLISISPEEGARLIKL
ncbi:MAG: hypothetical protein CVU77_07385 [Elusimicrobia bacterium HGW-Elusimicrobia-1]|jgi:hypothetical protein|nr:MAG: hypothetical protein CVU77_07385 [Elusimicrobia bacterium HGW-Elusimicrobia-1]